MRDRPLGAGLQELASNRLKLLWEERREAFLLCEENGISVLEFYPPTQKTTGSARG